MLILENKTSYWSYLLNDQVYCSFLFDRVCPPQVRIFVNQLYGPAYIAAGVQPDYRSDLLAIRFASFNPILDPWVYILCRKNLFSKCCEWIKRTMDLSRESPARRSGWVLGQNSPASLVHSNATSYASLHAASCRNAVVKLNTVTAKSYVDLSVRQAWDLDTAVDDFHPFSVRQSPVLGSESETASGCEMTTVKTSGCVQATPMMSCSKVLEHKAVIVTCTFSTPSSCLSEECWGTSHTLIRLRVQRNALSLMNCNLQAHLRLSPVSPHASRQELPCFYLSTDKTKSALEKCLFLLLFICFCFVF